MLTPCALVAARNARLLGRLTHELHDACSLDTARSSSEALAKLWRKPYAVMFFDPDLMEPGAVEMARRISPGMRLVALTAQDLSGVTEVINRWQATQPGQEEAAREFG